MIETQVLTPGNLKEALPFEPASFDLIVSAGLFMPGHVDHEVIALGGPSTAEPLPSR